MVNKKIVKKAILTLVKRLKAKGKASYDTDVSRATREVIGDYFDRLGVEVPVVSLNSSGCSYQRKSSGCFHCGHLKGYEKPEEMFQQFVADVERIKRKDRIYAYSNGSFLDPKEIPVETQKNILEHLTKQGYKRVNIESTPDMVNEEHLEELLRVIDSKQLYIGLGFDTYSDGIRDLCLNKGFSRENYDEAIEILNRKNVAFETRVVVKPPFLTEKEGIEEAIKTTRYAFDKGSSKVSLEPIAIQEYTLQDYLVSKGKYRVPWLWSIVSIVGEIHKLGKISIAGERFYPLPYETVHNCDKCDSEIKQAIYQFNKTQCFGELDKFDCSCKEQWKNDLAKKEVGLYERALSKIN